MIIIYVHIIITQLNLNKYICLHKPDAIHTVGERSSISLK